MTASCLFAVLSADRAGAIGLVFVDANDDFVASGEPDGGSFGPNANLAPETTFHQSVNAVDGLWGWRNNFGGEGPSGRFIWESSGTPGAEDAPEISQTVSGLAPNQTYDFYAVYWSSGANWTIRAGVAPGNLLLYDRFGTTPGATAGVPAYTATWDAPPTSIGAPLFIEADRTMFLGRAGTVASNGAGQATVYVDDLPGTDANNRTWLDGVAYIPAGNALPPLGDFNGVGGITLADYLVLSQNLHRDLAPTTLQDAYHLGDMNADLAVTYADFVAFRAAYDAVNGLGSLDEALASIPEPTTMLVVAAAVPAVIALRRRGALRRLAALALACLVSAACAPHAAAQISYVDATPANTVQAAGGAIVTSGDANGTDNIWRLRPLGNGATVYESGGDISATGSAVDGDNENTPRWATTISGLLPNRTYETFAYLWSPAGSQDWNLQAATTNPAGDLSVFSRTTTAAAVAANFATAPLVTEGDRTLYQAPLGFAKANGAGQATIFIDDHPAPRQGIANGWSFRSWYDGVGYALATTLTLRVDVATGAMSILNGETIGFDVNYYEIRSAAGSLNTANWTSIDGNMPASDTSWEKAGGSDDNLLSETNLLGMASFAAAPSAAVALGKAFDAGGEQDLQFFFGPVNGGGVLRRGLVEYVTATPGDFDVDKDVDGPDFLVWQRGLGSLYTSGDFANWKANFGTITAASATPEPSGLAMCPVAMGWLLVVVGDRRARVRFPKGHAHAAMFRHPSDGF
jgi:hypothetical protein